LGSIFWSYLIGALQVVFPELGQAEQRMLSFSKTPPIESILTGLLNQIGTRAERIVLILDDYHVITQPGIHAGMAFILEHIPRNLQLVISTRADPPLPLSRLRVRGRLYEVRGAELAFTLSEAQLLINDRMGLGLSEGDLGALQQRTEGWAAGVQLAAILLMDESRKSAAGQSEERLSALVERLSGRHHLIADYLLEEVFSRQPQDIQRFLLETSVLDELCAPLCAALLGDEDGGPAAQAILEFLAQTNLFLISLDEEHTWFRYHHLFMEALRIRLEHSYPDRKSMLHQRASRWYERNGYADKAIEQALAAADYDRAASLVETNAFTFARQGSYGLLSHWLEQLPAETLLSHPRLSILNSRALALSGKLLSAEQQLRAVELTLASTSDPLTLQARGQIAAVRATAAILNADPVAAKEQALLALDLLPRDDPARGGVLLVMGDAALMSGDIHQGIERLREAAVQCRQNQDLSVLLTVFAHLGEGLGMQGRLREVNAACLEALEEVNNQLGAGDWPLPSLALIYTLLGGARREWNDLAGAEEALERAVKIAEGCTYISALVNAYTGLAALRRSQGRIEQAIELVDKAMKAIHRQESALFEGVAQAVRADYLAQAGDLPATERWAEEHNVSGARPMDYLGDFELYSLARLWIAADRADEADALTGRLIAYAEASGRPGRATELLTLQALARHRAGKIDPALQSLERALLLGEAEGYVRTFLDEGEPLLQLLRNISRRKSPAAHYARVLLAKTDFIGPPAQEGHPIGQQEPERIEPLTARELAVLRQLAAGASNQEIAERLVISIGTVKAHIYHITAKLGARSRTEAVARAREAGYLA
jgi:LuxR family maltose regulon positive regulatory protein